LVRKPIPILMVSDTKEIAQDLVTWFRTFRPDVIVGHNSAIFHVLLDQGIRIPEEVAFVSREVLETETSLTGFKANHRNIGAVAINLLHAMIARGEYGIPEVPQTILISNDWNEGTTAPQRNDHRC